MDAKKIASSYEQGSYKSGETVTLSAYEPEISKLSFRGFAGFGFGYNEIRLSFLNIFYFDLPKDLCGFEINLGTNKHEIILREKLGTRYGNLTVGKPFVVKSGDNEFLVCAGAWTITGLNPGRRALN